MAILSVPNLAPTSYRLRQQAQLLREAASKLDEAAAMIDGGPQESLSNQISLPEISLQIQPYGRSERRQELVKLFMTHGPLTRKKILELLPEMPRGTLGYLLKDRRYFSGRHRKWNVLQ